jgi:hypothetical protein
LDRRDNGLTCQAMLANAFSGLKFERGEGGRLKIEADGEAAAILAGVFRGMAELFASMDQ